MTWVEDRINKKGAVITAPYGKLSDVDYVSSRQFQVDRSSHLSMIHLIHSRT